MISTNADLLIIFHYVLSILLATAGIVLATCLLIAPAVGCLIAGSVNLAIAGMFLKQCQRASNYRIF